MPKKAEQKPVWGRGPGRGMLRGGEKPRNFRGTLKTLLLTLSPYQWWIVLALLLAVFSTVFTIVGPKILALATDELVNGLGRMVTGSKKGIDFTYIGKIILFLMALYGGSALCAYGQNYIMAGVSTKVSYALRQGLEEKINCLPLTYFHEHSHGDILSRITNDIDTLNQSLNQSITQLITSSCSLVGVLIMMLTISWQLTLVAFGMVPLSLLLVSGVVRFSQKHFQRQQKHLGLVNGHVEEMFGGHLIIKAFNQEKNSLARFDWENEMLYKAAWKAQFFSGLLHPLMSFVGNLGYVAICVVGAALTAQGLMTIGGIQAFIQYVRSFTQPITQMANISNQLQTSLAAAERIFALLEEEEERKERPTVTTKEACIKGNILFDQVKFGYGPGQPLVLKNFSTCIKAGQKVALVGPTGAGKTTIVKLLMRFYEVQEGAIYIDGYDIRDFSRQDLRSQFGMVLQDTWLYHGTILDNIRYGKLTASEEEVIAAAKAAQVDRFVRTLPQGYHMVLNEEASNVSQGQKQLLTIARAILADTKLLILDEATSSVDTRTEVLIQKAMDNLMQNRTSFIIAHRLSTIRNADLIVCLQDGDIVEQGTHQELMARKGFYATLYNSQFARIS